ncbi:hypothetical protein [Hymenobacter lucidus]|uniref:Glycosyltransferase RgtA/B/C/D-like domain-containing protein n=1 Tax=Hymenobacter lucidus TaxID=2880930 RepID=A0ABS8AXU8_9BACT|nr:hypothetical protein [Hymenobacter lucidus]MCB2410646.1 hypothetical protein [Hymenobacter lucidus]
MPVDIPAPTGQTVAAGGPMNGPPTNSANSQAELPSAALAAWVSGGVFLLYCLYLPFSGYSEMVYDALGYWTLTERFFHAGHFSLLAYDDTLRGYLLPLLNLPAKAIAHFTGAEPLLLTRLMGAGWAALLFGWLAPALWLTLFPRHRLGWPPRVAFAALGFLFWRDYFNFVLSDFPALAMLLLALRLSLQRPGLLRAILTGACLMAASNIRPIYLLAVPAVALLALVSAAYRQRLLVLTGMVVGGTLLSGPQLLMNGRHHGIWTPLVLSRDTRLPTANLYLTQLGWGVVIQKYETSLDPAFPAPRMLYPDPAGQALLQRLGSRHFSGYGAYAATVLGEPLAFATLYGRHLFNGLDVQYPTPFVRAVPQRSNLLMGLHYSVWFGALAMLGAAFRHWRQSGAWRVALVVLALGLPCLASLPIAVECRFLLPLHLLLYAVTCFGGAQWQLAQPRWSWAKAGLLAAGYGLFLLLCFRLSAQTQAQLTHDVTVLAPLGGTKAQR